MIEYEYRLAIYKVIIEKRKNSILSESTKHKLIQILSTKSTNLTNYREFFILLMLFHFQENNKDMENILLEKYKKEFQFFLKGRNLPTRHSKEVAVGQTLDGEFGSYKKKIVYPLRDYLNLTERDLDANHDFFWGVNLEECVDLILTTND